jgi:hypothetical protein
LTAFDPADGAAGPARRLRAVRWLGLAATPTFAFMALVSGVLGGGHLPVCGASPTPWALTGMVSMYLLMAAFHAAPWLRLGAGDAR